MRPQVSLTSLQSDLQELAKFTDSKVGCTRVAYTRMDQASRQWLAARMEELGMTVTTDAVGNQIGRLPGAVPKLKPLALGSHTDTVPEGGIFDGALGVLAGLACIRALREAGVALRHPLELINFTAEEALVGGGTLGSRAMAGLLTPTVFAQSAWDGRTVAEHLQGAGFSPQAAVQAERPKGSLAAFLELHIEQGGLLDAAGIPIGVVEGIVGIRRFSVRFEGFANHAGTTPMDQRADALVMAASFVLAVRDEAAKRGIVGTTGVIRIEPGAPNVIPGVCELQVEIRGLDPLVLDEAEAALARRTAEIGPGRFDRTVAKPHASSDPMILTLMQEACHEAGVPCRLMPSGAGHDAMCMAELAPIAMLFVPSRNGISHSSAEWTDWEACGIGAQILLDTLLKLDAREI